MSASMLLLLGAAAIVGSANAAAINCTYRYQAALQVALSIKEECGNIEFKDCCQAHKAADLFQVRPQAGVFVINDVCAHKEPFQEQATVRAKCDVEGEDSGWLVILRRDNTLGTSEYVDFSRGWLDYVNGFGDLNTEFWYGLRNMHCVTTREDVDLRIILRKGDGTEEIYIYHTFKVGGPHTNYTLIVGDILNPAPGPDGMAYHNGSQFTTSEADHDGWSCCNCALNTGEGGGGGWWYKSCSYVVFTAPHGSIPKIRWYTHQDYADVVEMQIRPKTCTKCKVAAAAR